jgi:hypothetical protein
LYSSVVPVCGPVGSRGTSVGVLVNVGMEVSVGAGVSVGKDVAVGTGVDCPQAEMTVSASANNIIRIRFIMSDLPLRRMKDAMQFSINYRFFLPKV